MKNYENNERLIIIANLIIFIFVVICWIVNLVKFTECDFEAPYKSEIIHGIGVFMPPASAVTCWFPIEEKNK